MPAADSEAKTNNDELQYLNLIRNIIETGIIFN